MKYSLLCRRHRRCEFDPQVGKILWRRKWQPTPVFLPREYHGQRNGRKEVDTTQLLSVHTHGMKIDNLVQVTLGQSPQGTKFWVIQGLSGPPTTQRVSTPTPYPSSRRGSCHQFLYLLRVLIHKLDQFWRPCIQFCGSSKPVAVCLFLLVFTVLLPSSLYSPDLCVNVI